jgi:hypothetical protein
MPYTEASGLWYHGRWDIGSGFPDPAWAGSDWVVSVGGVLNNVSYQPGDWLVYEGHGVWDKVDNTELPYVLYKGLWDASTQAFPPAQPTTIFTELRQGHYYRINVAGTIAGVHYKVGDLMVYEGNSTWYKLEKPFAVVAGDGIRIDIDPTTETHTVVNIANIYKNVQPLNINEIMRGDGVIISDPNPTADQPATSAITLYDTLNLQGGTDISITTERSGDSIKDDIIRITNKRPRQFCWGRFGITNQEGSVGPQPTLEADQANDIANFVGGTGIIITSDADSDTMIFNNSNIQHPIWVYNNIFELGNGMGGSQGLQIDFNFNPWVAQYNAYLTAQSAGISKITYNYPASEFVLAVSASEATNSNWFSHYYYISHSDANYGAGDYEHEAFQVRPNFGDPLRFQIRTVRYFRTDSGSGSYGGAGMAVGALVMVLFGHSSVLQRGDSVNCAVQSAPTITL